MDQETPRSRQAPPRRAAKSAKNSRTSAAQIAKAKKVATALGLREQGYSYAEISAAGSRACRELPG